MDVRSLMEMFNRADQQRRIDGRHRLKTLILDLVERTDAELSHTELAAIDAILAAAGATRTSLAKDVATLVEFRRVEKLVAATDEAALRTELDRAQRLVESTVREMQDQHFQPGGVTLELHERHHGARESVAATRCGIEDLKMWRQKLTSMKIEHRELLTA